MGIKVVAVGAFLLAIGIITIIAHFHVSSFDDDIVGGVGWMLIALSTVGLFLGLTKGGFKWGALAAMFFGLGLMLLLAKYESQLFESDYNIQVGIIGSSIGAMLVMLGARMTIKKYKNGQKRDSKLEKLLDGWDMMFGNEKLV
jgi:hypothetical protein